MSSLLDYNRLCADRLYEYPSSPADLIRWIQLHEREYQPLAPTPKKL